jgi:serine protease inhibitor
MRYATLSTLAVTAMGMAACGDATAPIVELPRELTVAEAKLVAADNRFAFKLFRQVATQEATEANVLISPLSVGMALGMAYNGAAGGTRDAMQATLELQGMSLQEVNEAYQSLIALLRDLDPTVEFILANSVWHRHEIPVVAAFLENMRSYFDADVTAMDFAAPGAADVINGWVRDHTGGRIDEIVTPPIDPLTIMFLINAIYFKGTWTTEFDPDDTRDAAFYRIDGSTSTVRMMARDQTPVRAFMGSDFTVAELPYGGGAWAMTIVYPHDPGAITTLASDLTEDQWNSWIAALDSTSMSVAMPRYTVEYEIELSNVLGALGMGIAFQPYEADFSNLVAAEDAHIDAVKHKTFMAVDEKGTEAAAVTSVEVGVTSMPPSIRVDRPFIVAIRERFSGSILFLGRMVDPQD